MSAFDRSRRRPLRAPEERGGGGGAVPPTGPPGPPGPSGPPAEKGENGESGESSDPAAEYLSQPVAEPAGEANRESRRRRLSKWVERRATTVVSTLYKSQADDLQDRARRAVSSAYEERADDLEERAVRAMRRALSEEADRFKEVIEHAVAVKKREVRLSLLVLLTAAIVYFLLDWFASGRQG